MLIPVFTSYLSNPLKLGADSFKDNSNVRRKGVKIW